MSYRFNFNNSPEDKATYVKWRRAVGIFYGCIGLVAVAVAVATHLSGPAFQLAGN
jgi:hypothetical protein